MTDQLDHPQIYLITPSVVDLDLFPNRMNSVLDAVDVACVRLALAATDLDDIARVADALRETCHARDIPIVIQDHVLLVERLGLDGVHLTDSARSVRKMRQDLGDEAVVGAFCGISNHDGMTAGELGADYVSFGPVGDTDLGDGSRAELDLFQWWSQMIEVPVVAEGALNADLIRTFAPHADFFGIGDEIWRDEDAAAALKAFHSAML